MKDSIIFFFFFFIIHFLYLPAVDEKMEKTLKDFETYVEAQRQAWKVQGIAIGIIKDDKILLSKGYGQRGLTDKRPVEGMGSFDKLSIETSNKK